MAVFIFLPRPCPAEWTIAAYLGSASTQESYLRIHQPRRNTDIRFSPVGYDGRSFDAPPYYGIRCGYFLTPHLGLEAELIHLKVYAHIDGPAKAEGVLAGERLDATIPISSMVGGFSISHGVNLVLGNVVYRRRLPGRLVLASRFGLGGSVPHPESEIFGVVAEQYQGGRWGMQLAGGPEVQIWRGLHALAEYKYTRTRQRVRIHEGNAETLLRSHHVLFGLAVRF